MNWNDSSPKGRYSRTSLPLLRQLSSEEYAACPLNCGVSRLSIRTKPVRENVYGIASQIVGEYREVDREDMNRDSRYRLGDYKGKSGVEALFETDLRGIPGIRHHLVDVRNNVRNTLTDMDSLPVTGADVTLTLDADLQRYAEQLMEGKRGAVVAIEPTTGEILAFVSAPSYDGNLLTGTSRGAAYDSLAKHPWKPLYNAPCAAPTDLAPFSNGPRADCHGARVISPRTHIDCNRDIIGCHGAHTQDDLRRAVSTAATPTSTRSCGAWSTSIQTKTSLTTRVWAGWWTDRIKTLGWGLTWGHIPGTRLDWSPTPPITTTSMVGAIGRTAPSTPSALGG